MVRTTSADSVGDDHSRPAGKIDGHAATVSDRDDARCVSWTDGTGFSYQVCSPTRHTPELSLAALTKIARSVH